MIIQDRRLLAGAAGALLVAGAAGFGIARWSASVPAKAIEAKEEPAGPGSESAPKDTVVMNADGLRRTGIVTEMIRSGGLGAEIVAQATVSASPSGEAIVTARAGGAVTRIFKRLGDPVRAGEALAIVESRDAAQFAADRTAATAKATLAQKSLARESYLYRQRVSARVDLEQAQAEAAAANAEARRAQAAAAAAKVTADGRGVTVSSPISGRVTAEAASLGAFVQPETELFRVADPRKIQIEAAVGALDAQRIAAGDTAIVELPDGRTVSARVRAVTPSLSGETRSATAVLDIGSVLQPGLAVRVRIQSRYGRSSAAIVVPEEAVQSFEGRDVVFVRTELGFRAASVTTGQRSAGRVEIVSGLKAGQTIATSNAFLLKAELAKGTGDEE
jgi:cobalt-zinc-cadmium efflux system membrane fusion protein